MEELKDMSILNLKKGDIVIFRYKGRLKDCEYEMATKQIKDKFEPFGIKAMIVDESMDVSVLR